MTEIEKIPLFKKLGGVTGESEPEPPPKRATCDVLRHLLVLAGGPRHDGLEGGRRDLEAAHLREEPEHPARGDVAQALDLAGVELRVGVHGLGNLGGLLASGAAALRRAHVDIGDALRRHDLDRVDLRLLLAQAGFKTDAVQGAQSAQIRRV